MIGRAFFRLLVFVALTALAVSGCVPAAADPRPHVVIVNAPAQYRVPILADEFAAALRDDAASGAFALVSSSPIRFQETHRDMVGGRAPLQAAFIARRFNSDYAVMIGAPLYERLVLPLSGGTRLVTIAIELEAVIVDAATAEPRSRYHASAAATRVEFTRRPLVPLEEDRDLRQARRQALESLAFPVATELAILVSP